MWPMSSMPHVKYSSKQTMAVPRTTGTDRATPTSQRLAPPSPHLSWLVIEPMLSVRLPTVSRGLSTPVLLAAEAARQKPAVGGQAQQQAQRQRAGLPQECDSAGRGPPPPLPARPTCAPRRLQPPAVLVPVAACIAARIGAASRRQVARVGGGHGRRPAAAGPLGTAVVAIAGCMRPARSSRSAGGQRGRRRLVLSRLESTEQLGSDRQAAAAAGGA